ncbi:MAG: hypothetical protein ACYC4N_31380, partial [Pirellulaceae bacterium]
MPAKHGGRRLLGCCYMLLFIVALLSILVYGCYRSERQRMAESEQRVLSAGVQNLFEGRGGGGDEGARGGRHRAR